MSTVVQGFVAPGFESVRDAFGAGFSGKPEMGAALAVRHDGKSVVDLWGGVANPETGAQWHEDTLCVVFSCTKGLTAILAARLVQDGLLSYDAPVTTYWPEFGAAGKERTTVRDLLSHRAGLSAPRAALTTSDITDWSTVVTHLAAQEPLWEPGSGYAYHSITHGWLIGEVIRRVTGKSVGQYFAELVSKPLHADVWIGLPPELHERVALMHVGPSLAEMYALVAAGRSPGVVDWSELAMTLGGALPEELVGSDVGFNDAAVQSAEIPGAGGISTARALASAWSATFVRTDGVRLLDDETIDAATALQSGGPPVFDVPPPWPNWGMGFQLHSEAREYLTPTGFGHDGAGGQVSFADPKAGIGFAYITNQMEGNGDLRGTRIVDAVRSTLHL